MPEKGTNSPRSKLNHLPWLFRPTPLHQWRFHFLTALVFLAMVLVWSLDGCTVKSFIQSLSSDQHRHQLLTVKFRPQPTNLAQEKENTHPNSTNGTTVIFAAADSPSPLPVPPDVLATNESAADDELLKMPTRMKVDSTATADGDAEWATAELEPNFTSGLLSRWLTPGGKPCMDEKTADVLFPDLDGKGSESTTVELTAGDSHEFVFQAVDESRNPRCSGGDYFESDLSGESWKSRPPVRDFGNGSYSISLQVHPDFAGDYDLTLILLYRHFEGLKFSPKRFVFNKELRKLRIRFVKAHTQLPELKFCSGADFDRDLWVGRWTRHGKNDDCKISRDGRYRCLPADFPCRNPWCNGSLGSLESNGWVYSSHCSFKLFKADSAWNCLKNRWIFFWGDSNHVDTIRNLLNFVLDLPDVKSVPRRFDWHFTNPKDSSQSVRITSIFNGHWNETQNYQGLNSLKNEGFRDLVKKYFTEEKAVPDTVILNSGLHDGIYWPNIRRFAGGADYAAEFWKEVMDSVRRRGLVPPRMLYRTTVATGGDARSMAFNPSKMEAFNWVVLDKFRRAGLLSGVIDNFDMTFPWHFNNRCNDGVHYGRAPLKMKWKDGEIGHQYFVDLMLAHVLLNVLCAAP